MQPAEVTPVSRPAPSSTRIRLVVVDDHPAVRAGLVAMLAGEAGTEIVGTGATAQEGYGLVESQKPDVVILDYNLVGEDGLSLTYRIKRAQKPPPRVLILSAFADDALAVMAAIAGADGVVSKGDQLNLGKATAALVRGHVLFPPVSPRMMDAIGSTLAAEDLPILGMLMNGVSEREIAETLKLEPAWVAVRRWEMLETLNDRQPPSWS